MAVEKTADGLVRLGRTSSYEVLDHARTGVVLLADFNEASLLVVVNVGPYSQETGFTRSSCFGRAFSNVIY
jgi:hypothetical protein